MRQHLSGLLAGARIAGACFAAASLCAQSYSPLYAPQSSVQEVFQCCYTGSNGGHIGMPYAYFQAATGYYRYINYHYHESSTHRYSSVSPTSGYADGNGYITLAVSTRLVRQAEALQLSCSAPGFNPAYLT